MATTDSHNEKPDVAEAARQPLAIAGQWLTRAQQAGDAPKTVAALTELGILALHDRQTQRAIFLLQKALTLVRALDDRSQENDVLDNLGLALLANGQTKDALPVFQEALTIARTANDPFAEKAVLEHLGTAHAQRGDPNSALACFGPALTVTRRVGDRHQETDLLWQLAIQHAELGQRDQALIHAQAAVDLMRQVQPADANWFAEHLQKYQNNEAVFPSRPDSEPASIRSVPPRTCTPHAKPSWLTMALTATRALARYVGSGLEKVSPEVHQRRVETCTACPHHTGIRCRLCGCFTTAKAWLPHEDCPLGKWGAV